jgi:hypothetical protein
MQCEMRSKSRSRGLDTAFRGVHPELAEGLQTYSADARSLIINDIGVGVYQGWVAKGPPWEKAGGPLIDKTSGCGGVQLK